jgi:hypothetical protein
MVQHQQRRVLMKSTRWLIGMLVVLFFAVTVALAQQGMGRGAGGPGMMGGNPAICATDKYVFVLRGNTLIQLDINTLEIVKQKDLEPVRQADADAAGPNGPNGPNGPGASGRPFRGQGQGQGQGGRPGRPRGAGAADGDAGQQ